jgi:hypothetical protein
MAIMKEGQEDVRNYNRNDMSCIQQN